MLTREAIGSVARLGFRRSRCARCGGSRHVIDDDGPAVCRVCLFAWGHYARALRSGETVPELGGLQLRHVAHETPLLGCPLCRAQQVRSAASFDGWARGRGA